jgi:hypothetical protein
VALACFWAPSVDACCCHRQPIVTRFRQPANRQDVRGLRAISVPVQAYLTWVFERLMTHRDQFGLELHEMTPDAYKQSLAE